MLRGVGVWGVDRERRERKEGRKGTDNATAREGVLSARSEGEITATQLRRRVAEAARRQKVSTQTKEGKKGRKKVLTRR